MEQEPEIEHLASGVATLDSPGHRLSIRTDAEQCSPAKPEAVAEQAFAQLFGKAYEAGLHSA